MLQFGLRTVDSDSTILSRQHRKFYRNSIDINDHHNKPITKQNKKSITSLKENIENRSPILKNRKDEEGNIKTVEKRKRNKRAVMRTWCF